MGEKISKATAIFYQIVVLCVCKGCVCVRVSLAQPPRNSIISKYYTDRHTRMRVLESEIKNKKQGKGGKKEEHKEQSVASLLCPRVKYKQATRLGSNSIGLAGETRSNRFPASRLLTALTLAARTSYTCCLCLASCHTRIHTHTHAHAHLT